jgi:hypothetical protein
MLHWHGGGGGVVVVVVVVVLPLGHSVLQTPRIQTWSALIVPAPLLPPVVELPISIPPFTFKFPAFVCATPLVLIGAPTLPFGGFAPGSVHARTNCKAKPKAAPMTTTESHRLNWFLFNFFFIET